MIKTEIFEREFLPEDYRELISGAKIYDSSSSNEAKVYFIDKDGGFYLKRAKGGALAREAEMARYFEKKGLAPRVIDYMSGGEDWLLTEKARGEDCTCQKYLDEPKKLCVIMAELLRGLHEADARDCPVKNRIETYVETAKANYDAGIFEKYVFFGNFRYDTAHDAMLAADEGKGLLKNDVLIHGDFCLPNIILDDWTFGAFIDVGNGGIGDRHIDLFWGAWSLGYNLKTEGYTGLFFDAYGREKIDIETIKVVAAFEAFG